MPKAPAWKPGISGNPKGRPRIRSLEDAMQQKLRRHYIELAASLMEIATHAKTTSGTPDYALRMRAAETVLRVTKGAAGAPAARKMKASSVKVEEEESNGTQYQVTEATPSPSTDGQ